MHLNNKITVITMWAYGIKRSEIFNRELLAIKSKYDLNLIGVAAKGDLEKSILWIRQTPNPFQTNYYDQDQEFIGQYNIFGIPESIIIDEKGRVIKSVFSSSDISDAIDEYMRTHQMQ